MTKKIPPLFPTKEQLLDYIKSQPRPVSRRDIAQAFQIKGADRIPMKALLKDLVSVGALEHTSGAYHKPEKFELVQVEIYAIDVTGDLLAKPLLKEGSFPKIYIFSARVHRGRKYLPSLTVGDQALVKLIRLDKYSFEGRVVRKIEKHVTEQIIGKIVESRFGRWIEP